MNHGLVFASGPTPSDPEHARMLGYEERKLGELIDAGGGRMFAHRASVPELIAYVRARGADCTYQPFGDRHALLRVSSREGSS